LIIYADESGEVVNEEDDDEESGEESEFVPSCWNMSLQPSKSSLKSPERESNVRIEIHARIQLINLFNFSNNLISKINLRKDVELHLKFNAIIACTNIQHQVKLFSYHQLIANLNCGRTTILMIFAAPLISLPTQIPYLMFPIHWTDLAFLHLRDRSAIIRINCTTRGLMKLLTFRGHNSRFASYQTILSNKFLIKK
jgi:hypothetical protein